MPFSQADQPPRIVSDVKLIEQNLLSRSLLSTTMNIRTNLPYSSNTSYPPAFLETIHLSTKITNPTPPQLHRPPETTNPTTGSSLQIYTYFPPPMPWPPSVSQPRNWPGRET
mmetsp:Transcript_23593/g.48842  ORF Transcript_23593/g.48842 Transcript_23593/m.48842 type:complete len:112 (+) Transcript_23593:150-485(+)